MLQEIWYFFLQILKKKEDLVKSRGAYVSIEGPLGLSGYHPHIH